MADIQATRMNIGLISRGDQWSFQIEMGMSSSEDAKTFYDACMKDIMERGSLQLNFTGCKIEGEPTWATPPKSHGPTEPSTPG